MKATYLFGILAACALSMGCVAQAGTEDPTGASEESLGTTTIAAEQQQQPATPQTRLLHTSRLTEVREVQPIQQIHNLEGLAGTDPSAPVTDDGDGKEPDPHPWHADTAIVAAH